MNRKPDWLQGKGYLHISPSLNIESNWKELMHKIKSPTYIAKYAFYPLMHRILSDRKYKKPNSVKHEGIKRRHSHLNIQTHKVERSKKDRPLHYASHFDALIFAYYAHELNKRYEKKLKPNKELNKAVLAYRTIPISSTNEKGKSNIHFANEVFEEIKRRVEIHGDVAALAIDLKSFFSSLSHQHLFKCWAQLLETDSLPSDHLNVFRACTNFSYVLYNDLKQTKKVGFDEAKLAKIRRTKGFKCFFESNEEFRKYIQEGLLPIYKNPFRRTNKNGKKEMIGIPQGLPISAILANLYLLEFDTTIINELQEKLGVYYRRYSDDILILCAPGQVDQINEYVNDLIQQYEVEISKDKTEQYLFKNLVFNKNGETRVSSIKMTKTNCVVDAPLTYLGFEFRGHNTLIKSTNIAKYYRRVIEIIKRRSKRAIKLSQHAPHVPKAVYVNQIKRLYNAPLKYANKTEAKQVFRRRYSLMIDDRGDFIFKFSDVEIKHQSNYISYIKRCKREFNTNSFSRQLKKKKQIIGQAINKHLVKKG